LISSISGSVDEGRFLPGTVLAGRYRVAGLLGRGGMGEVYRATDLALGQAVALKFLPEATARDDRALARFYNEVRTARQVTHPNVCRVYDIGQVDGSHYISMEYVDGEDLGSLLRRIGRLPADKALEIARKLCAGLAAAHEKGVLHRDLKPANVMIDGRGHVVIMDFGLAGLVDQLQGDIRSGTPAYMAPEQLAGTDVTARSDIYALGLLLYELFTGKRAFEAASLMELMQLQERAAPASITSIAKDLDPAVEGVILRCLRPDPSQRPASALAVAARLPGGDPLAAALAAGEMPSPELVAAAGETEGLRPAVAIAWLAAALVGIVAIGAVGAKLGITQKVQLDVPPEALARDAANLLKSFGYTAKPGDRVWGFEYNWEYDGYLRQHRELAAARWKNPAGVPPLIDFWYRESPWDMVALKDFNVSVDFGDPEFATSGMVRLKTDPEGKLLELGAVPPQMEAPAPPSPAFDWNTLFRAAGLELARFQTSEPQWTPLANWDARAAWTGADPSTGAKLRIEASAWRGRPVFFRILGPWSKPERMEPWRTRQGMVSLALMYLALAAGTLIAWYNFRAGRADLAGAGKLGLIYFAAMLGGRFLMAHHTSQVAELSIFWRSVSVAAINGGVLFALYVALEPWVRQRWPQTMISWSRYTTKGIRDPMVGRDILYGAALGCVWAGVKLAQLALHGSSGEPVMPPLAPLLGLRHAAAGGLDAFTGSLFDPILTFFMLFLTRVVVRKQWIAAAAFIVVGTLVDSGGTSYPWIDYTANALFAGLAVFVLLRFGLLALIATEAFSQFLTGVPRTLDFSAWYAGIGVASLVLVALMAIYGFRTSLAGRRLLDPGRASST
jgi:serine/threonine-protein kinase